MPQGFLVTRVYGWTMDHLEDEIARLHGRIAQLESEKADVEAFAAVAAHELLAPLVLADAYATTVADRLDHAVHADERRDLDALRAAASRTRLLVETLLHDARSHGRPLRLRAIDLEGLVRESLTLVEPEMEARGAEVQVEPLPVALGEEALVGAVFTNLLLNALRYGPREHATIVIRAAVRDGVCRVCVESEGPAIPAADRERIFARYQRGRGERRARGAGLGLTICRHIVERHGGEIGVTAEASGVNSFYFTLPASPRGAAAQGVSRFHGARMRPKAPVPG